MLGSRIAALRARFGWSQAELARRLHISPSAVGMYEQGRREPSVEVIVALARVLGVSVDYLLTGNSLCNRDWRAQAAISASGKLPSMVPEWSSLFSRDELMVLLAASAFGSDRD